jgi:hypothetical protein
MYSRSAKGGEKENPNRNPWLAKMLEDILHFIITESMVLFIEYEKTSQTKYNNY